MVTSSRAAVAFVVLLALLAPGARAFGETEPSAPAENAEARAADRIREAWAEIHRLQRTGKSDEARTRQTVFAGEFFEYYRAQPETRSGREALATAFRMWGQAGDAQAIEAAMARIDRSSRRWVQLIQLARPAFVAGDRLEEYREIVTKLAAELTAPDIASEVWIVLGRDFRSTADLERARDCFRRAIALEADPRLTESARTALRSMDRLAVGRSAPGFTAIDLQGQRIRLSDLAGRFVLLLFWSSDCESCLAEIDHLRRVRVTYPRERVEMIGIALDPRADDVRRVVETRRIDWPQIFHEEALDGPVPRLYEVREVPRSFLVGPEGLIVARDVLGEELDALLAERLPQTPAAQPASGAK